MLLTDIDLMREVDEYNHVITNEQGLVDMPTVRTSELLDGPDEDLEVNEEIDPGKIADLLDDSKRNPSSTIPPVINDGDNELAEDAEDDEGSNDDPEISEEFVNDFTDDTIPDLESEVAEGGIPPEVDEQPSRATRQLEQYNPSSGQSYAQVELSHNIATQHLRSKNKLESCEHETVVVACTMIYLRGKYFVQKFNLRKGLKEFDDEGINASKAELQQMRERMCWRAVAVKDLTRKERMRAQESLIVLTKKKSGAIKGQLAFNGKPTRAWLGAEDKSSPTVLTESLFLTCVIDAHKRRDVMVLDIPNAFIQAGVPMKKKGKRKIMKI